jgi:hypothetical protein
VERFICVTCGTQFGPSTQPPARCPICDEPRQYVGQDGQRWTTLAALLDDHANVVADDHGLTGIRTEPHFAIGQRALLVPHGDRALLWDCVTVLDDAARAAVAAVAAAGGLSGIAISHPHYYSTMVEWAEAFDCPVHIHVDDSAWIQRPDGRLHLWEGDALELGDGITLLRLGGHFAGGTVLHHAGLLDGRGALLTGDILQVVPDRRFVSFMYSYPNLIPLPAATVEGMVEQLAPYAFERVYGAFAQAVVAEDGKAAVERSARRYVAALAGDPEVLRP